MIDFDSEIERCLEIVARNNSSFTMVEDFIIENENSEDVSSFGGWASDNAELVAKAMVREGLIEREGDRCDLTRFGSQVYKEGGWLKHVNKNNGQSSNSDFDNNELSKKIDEIIVGLKRNEMGTEIVFNELQEMKETSKVLSKKNWGQLLKGKLFDLALDKGAGLTTTAAGHIFFELTGNHIDKLLA